MAALIQGCLHIDIYKLEGTDDEKETEFARLWGMTKYYLETIHQVNFT
jgi:hypothetical protein